MDAMKLLSMEFMGIKGTIDQYTGESNIMNSIAQLQNAITGNDVEAITYQLREISLWYGNNIGNIRTNSYVTESELLSHERNWRLINELIKQFTDYVPPVQNAEEPTKLCKQPDKPIIFISHRSTDKKYGNALRNFIIGLGVQENQLIYTSHPLHKIPLDRNIYDYLRENINRNVFMIILWSDQYLESPACMNEMGAAWVVQSDYTNIYTPEFSFGNPKYHECAVDTRKMGAVLIPNEHCRTSMLELKDKVQSLFDLPNDEKKTTFLLEQFMKEIEN